MSKPKRKHKNSPVFIKEIFEQDGLIISDVAVNVIMRMLEKNNLTDVDVLDILSITLAKNFPDTEQMFKYFLGVLKNYEPSDESLLRYKDGK